MKYFPRAVSVPFALLYIEKNTLGAVCRALCCCIYVEGEIRFPSPTPMFRVIACFRQVPPGFARRAFQDTNCKLAGESQLSVEQTKLFFSGGNEQAI